MFRPVMIPLTAALLVFSAGPSALAEPGKWQILFDGETLDHFEAKNGGAIEGWVAVNRTIFRMGPGGDLVTKKEFENFELEFEWRVAPGSNSGIKYRYAKYNEGNNGPEYQVLDDAKHNNGEDPYTSAAAMYLLAKRSTNETVKKAGNWNKGKIVARGTHIEHWLNGTKVVDTDIGTEAFDEQLKQTKFKKYKAYGQLKGRILLQDHGDPVWYRNLRIREL